MGSQTQRGSKRVPLPVLENEKSYKQWKNAVSMWSLVTDVERNKQAMVVALNLTGKAREAALEIDSTDLNKDDGVATLLNRLDDRRLQTYKAFQKLDDLRRPPFRPLREYVTSFQNLCDQIRSLLISIPNEVLALKLLNGSGLAQTVQEDVLRSTEDFSISKIAEALLSGGHCNYGSAGDKTGICLSSSGAKSQTPGNTSSKSSTKYFPAPKTKQSTPRPRFVIKSPKQSAKLTGTTAKTSGSTVTSTAKPTLTNGSLKVEKKPGSWKCPSCYVVNESTDAKCSCCASANPDALSTSKPEDVRPKTGLFNFGLKTPVSSESKKENFVTTNPQKEEMFIPAWLKSSPGKSVSSTTTKIPECNRLEIYKKPLGSWKCPDCYVENESTDSKCPCCEKANPNTTTTAEKAELDKPKAGTFNFGERQESTFSFGGMKENVDTANLRKERNTDPTRGFTSNFGFGKPVKSAASFPKFRFGIYAEGCESTNRQSSNLDDSPHHQTSGFNFFRGSNTAEPNFQTFAAAKDKVGSKPEKKEANKDEKGQHSKLGIHYSDTMKFLEKKDEPTAALPNQNAPDCKPGPTFSFGILSKASSETASPFETAAWPFASVRPSVGFSTQPVHAAKPPASSGISVTKPQFGSSLFGGTHTQFGSSTFDAVQSKFGSSSSFGSAQMHSGSSSFSGPQSQFAFSQFGDAQYKFGSSPFGAVKSKYGPSSSFGGTQPQSGFLSFGGAQSQFGFSKSGGIQSKFGSSPFDGYQPKFVSSSSFGGTEPQFGPSFSRAQSQFGFSKSGGIQSKFGSSPFGGSQPKFQSSLFGGVQSIFGSSQSFESAANTNSNSGKLQSSDLFSSNFGLNLSKRDVQPSIESSKAGFSGPEKEGDDDIIFVSELKPTDEQRKRAEELLLPLTFFLFENKQIPPDFDDRTEDENEEKILKFIEERDNGTLRLMKNTGKPYSGSDLQYDDDIIFVSELKPTHDQRKRAEELLLPLTFFLFENKLMPPGFDENEEKILNFIEERDSKKLELKKKTEKVFFGSGDEAETDAAKLSNSSSDGSSWVFGGETEAAPTFDSIGTSSHAALASGVQKSGFEKDSSVHFSEAGQFIKPVLEELPPVIEVKTLEEGEEVLFKERCKLYRYDKDVKQWKERGVGEIKILQNDEHKLHRVVMRRDQIYKVCTNHVIGNNTNPELHLGSTKSCSYFVMDYSENQIPTPEKIAIRFKTDELCKAYMDKIAGIKRQRECWSLSHSPSFLDKLL